VIILMDKSRYFGIPMLQTGTVISWTWKQQLMLDRPTQNFVKALPRHGAKYRFTKER
jgi:hypothetical protein